MKHPIFALLLGLTASSAAPASISMAFGDNLPPYIIAGSDAGIEVEVVREALAYRGHVLQAHYLPMARVPHTFITGQVDSIMMDVGQDMTAHGGYYATPPVLYDNVFYTLKRRGLTIRKPKDLMGHTIMSFVGAARRYPEWLGALSHSSAYVERNNQAAQPMLLALGRYDIVLCDRAIFQYYMLQSKKADPSFIMPEVDVHAFARAVPANYRPVFRDAAIRDDFNAGLAQLRKSGRYKAIRDKYLKG